MNDILKEYYSQRFLSSPISKKTLVTEATKAITDHSRREQLLCSDDRIPLPFNPARNRFIFGNKKLKTPLKFPLLNNSSHSNSHLVKSEDNLGKQETKIKKKMINLHQPLRLFSKTELDGIHLDAKIRVEQLLQVNNTSNDDEQLPSSGMSSKRKRNDCYKEKEVDNMFFIRENMLLDPHNPALFKSNHAQIKCLGNESYRHTLINGVNDYNKNCIKYRNLKQPLIGKNRFESQSNSDEIKSLNVLAKEYDSFKKQKENVPLKKKNQHLLFNADDSGLDIQLKGMDTRLAYSLKASNAIYEKIMKNRTELYNKQKEIINLLNN